MQHEKLGTSPSRAHGLQLETGKGELESGAFFTTGLLTM